MPHVRVGYTKTHKKSRKYGVFGFVSKLVMQRLRQAAASCLKLPLHFVRLLTVMDNNIMIDLDAAQMNREARR
jgi:hypothetical protein